MNSDPTPTESEQATLDVEQALLGCIITNDRRAFDAAVVAGITSRHFLHEKHGGMWRAIADVVDAGGSPQSFAVLNEIGSQLGTDAKLYAAKTKTSLAFMTPNDARFLARDVLDHSMRRDAAEEVKIGLADLVEEGADVPARLGQLSSRLAEIGTRRASGFITAGAAAMRAIETIEKTARGELVRTKTGFADLDRKVGGLNPGRLYLIGGRPSMGKTAAALWIAWHVARANIPVLIFSLEMTSDELSMRWLSGLTGIELERMAAGDVNANDQSRLVAAKVDLDALPIRVEDRAGMSLAEIGGLARQALRGQPRAVVIIDHLGLVATPGMEGAGRVETTAAISNGMKTMAKQLGHPVIALAQLSRASEQRDDKMPQLSDLRWAGELEQDADVIIFLHRESYYLGRARPKRKPGQSDGELQSAIASWLSDIDDARGKAEFSVAKNRNGSIGVVAVGFDENTARFSDLARGDE